MEASIHPCSPRKGSPPSWIIVTKEGSTTNRQNVGHERAVAFCKQHGLPAPKQ